jgi:hypothetical protein
MDAAIEGEWRYTWRSRSEELRDALEGHDRAKLEGYMQEVDPEEINWEA